MKEGGGLKVDPEVLILGHSEKGGDMLGNGEVGWGLG